MDLLKRLSPRMTPSPLVLWQSQGRLQTRAVADCTRVHIQQSQQGGVCTVNSICRPARCYHRRPRPSPVRLQRVVSGTFHRSTCQCHLWGKWAVFFPSHPWVQISEAVPWLLHLLASSILHHTAFMYRSAELWAKPRTGESIPVERESLCSSQILV